MKIEYLDEGARQLKSEILPLDLAPSGLACRPSASTGFTKRAGAKDSAHALHLRSYGERHSRYCNCPEEPSNTRIPKNKEITRILLGEKPKVPRKIHCFGAYLVGVQISQRGHRIIITMTFTLIISSVQPAGLVCALRICMAQPYAVFTR